MLKLSEIPVFDGYLGNENVLVGRRAASDVVLAILQR
jgi:hypothetical protein